MNPSLALAITTGVAALGWRFRVLTPAGAGAAILVGTVSAIRTGWPGLAALGSFFVGGSALSRLAPDPGVDLGAKGARRDSAQVVANGGAAFLGSLLPGGGLWSVVASLAVAAADTWATAGGGWSRMPPRNILSGRVVPPGSSGGVTLTGSLNAVVGALTVGGAAAFAAGRAELLWLALIVGPPGMLLDSCLGAGWQGRFHCDACDQPTERPWHRCGHRARPVAGLAWLGNDLVNAMATLVGMLAGWCAWRWFGRP